MEGDRNCLDDAHEQIISIHSLRMEGDFSFPSAGRTAVHFNPLPPHGGRLPQCVCTSGFHAISIHSLRMEGDHRKNDNFAYSPDISIHSLRMEGDLILLISIHLYIISIHSLRMEGDWWQDVANVQQLAISIHSLRMEGDIFPNTLPAVYRHFNPLPPHGGRLVIFFNK